MTQELMFWPVIAMAALTFAVAPQILIRRLQAIFAGKASSEDFRNGESEQVPAEVSIPNRNYMNLLELPVLFYVVCIAFFVTRHTAPLDLGLAWTFTLARVAHSLVHLTYNNVLHRLAAFNLAAVCLAALWLRFALSLL